MRAEEIYKAAVKMDESFAEYMQAMCSVKTHWKKRLKKIKETGERLQKAEDELRIAIRIPRDK